MVNLRTPQYVFHHTPRARTSCGSDARHKLENIAARKGMVFAMAEVMTDRTAASGACTEEDLLSAGFTLDEIKMLSPAARRAAQRNGRG